MDIATFLTKESKKEFNRIIETSTAIREKFLKQIEDGSLHSEFIQDLRAVTNERGEKLTLEPWRQLYARLLIDCRIPLKVVSGAAQTGKSLMVILVYCWLVSRAGFNTLFMLPQSQAIQRLIPLNHDPVFQEMERILHKGKKRSHLTDNLKTKESLSSGNALFSAPVNKGESNEGATASTSVVSVSADLLVVDEVSQFLPGAVETATRRLDAGRIPSRPIIYSGTPGSGGGIEKYIKDCQYQFYPGLECRGCTKRILLHPFGALFKKSPVTLPTGEVTEVYVSSAGRPLKWDYSDEQDKISSVYLSCEYCSTKIEDQDLRAITFYDKATKLDIREFFEQGIIPDSVAIELSPLVRGYRGLSRVVREGLKTANPADWVQQALGIPSDFDSTSITEEQIRNAFGLSTPYVRRVEYEDGCDSVVVCGIDQGRGSDFLTIMRCYINPNAKSDREMFDTAVREFVFCNAVSRSEIPTICDRFGVEIGFIDNEPNITTAAELCEMVDGLALVDQQIKQKDSFIIKQVKDGGTEYQCVKLAYSKFVRTLIVGFSHKGFDKDLKYRFNSDLEGILTDVTETSAKRHLTSVAFDPETGKPVRPKDKNDDLFFATVFADAALAYYLERGVDYDNTASWDWFENL